MANSSPRWTLPLRKRNQDTRSDTPHTPLSASRVKRPWARDVKSPRDRPVSTLNVQAKVSASKQELSAQHIESTTCPTSIASSELNLTNLQSLPTELLIQVVTHLRFHDLLSLRATSRVLSFLITAPDSSLARYWYRHRLTPLTRTLYPVVHPSRLWDCVCEANRGYHVQVHVARAVIAYLCEHALRRITTDQQRTFAPTEHRLVRRLIPALGPISHYLASVRAFLLSSTILTDDVLISASSEIQAKYSAPVLLAAHKAWTLIMWLLNSMTARPSYAGRLERTMRGWTADPVDKTLVMRALVLGGIGILPELVAQNSYNSRRKWVVRFLEDLTPSENAKVNIHGKGNPAWMQKWRETHVETQYDIEHYDSSLDSRISNPDTEYPHAQNSVTASQATNALSFTLTDRDSLWSHSAYQILQCTGHESDISVEEVARANLVDPVHARSLLFMRFVAEWAGYDCFHDFSDPRLRDDYNEADMLGNEDQDLNIEALFCNMSEDHGERFVLQRSRPVLGSQQDYGGLAVVTM